MRNEICLLTVVCMLFTAPALHALEPDSIASELEQLQNYSARVTYSVTLPQAEDDIVYTINLEQPGPDDRYLINWSVDSPSGPQEGFTAWFDDNFYNFRNRRLQESHGQWDPQQPQRAPQNSAQFASLLPGRIAAQLRAMTPDRYDVLIRNLGKEILIEAWRKSGDIVDAELAWRLDAATFTPLEFSGDYNPGAISGQQVKAVYTSAASRLLSEELSEETLRELYPDAFGRYRESNFGIEQLRGEKLPEFSLPRIGVSGRYTREAGSRFSRPTALVLFDPANTLSPQLIEAVREAANSLLAPINILWAATSNDPTEAEELLGELPAGEIAVYNAEKLATKCGAANLPVVIACDASSTVRNLKIGLNNQLDIDVIRMFSTMK